MLSRWAGRPSERELSEPLVLGKIRKKTQKELSDKEAEALNCQCGKTNPGQTGKGALAEGEGERGWAIQCAVLETGIPLRASPSSFLLS